MIFKDPGKTYFILLSPVVSSSSLIHHVLQTAPVYYLFSTERVRFYSKFVLQSNDSHESDKLSPTPNAFQNFLTPLRNSV